MHTPVSSSNRESEKVVPVRLVVHGRKVAFLNHTVLLGEVGFGECLSWSAVFTRHKRDA
jgi:hypothetical protein